MGGLERAKALKSLAVRVVDVRAEDDVGFVALAQDDGSFGRSSLKRDRLYA